MSTEELTIADKIVRAKKDCDDLYNLGINKGYYIGLDEGRQAQYNEFWDVFQNYGNNQNMQHAFSRGKFTDANYKPKYTIKTEDAFSIFQNAQITDTLVEVDVTGGSLSYSFSTPYLKTIRKLKVTEKVTFNEYTFYNAKKLENITIEGTIATDISFATSPLLTKDSIISIINALKDYSGTTTTYTLTLHADSKAKLTETDIATITQKGWTLA